MLKGDLLWILFPLLISLIFQGCLYNTTSNECYDADSLAVLEKQYKDFADEYWSHARYERAINDYIGQLREEEARGIAMPTRQAFCEAVFGGDATSNPRVKQCEELQDENNLALQYTDLDHYRLAQDEPGEYDSDAGPADSIGDYRKNYDDLNDFYELVGKHQEYITGWRDADPSFDSTFKGESDRRDEYRMLRSNYEDYQECGH